MGLFGLISGLWDAIYTNQAPLSQEAGLDLDFSKR